MLQSGPGGTGVGGAFSSENSVELATWSLEVVPPVLPIHSGIFFLQLRRNRVTARSFFLTARLSCYPYAAVIKGARAPKSAVSTTVRCGVWNLGQL